MLHFGGCPTVSSSLENPVGEFLLAILVIRALLLACSASATDAGHEKRVPNLVVGSHEHERDTLESHR
eukprot:3159666-Amphidinium_carterae.1